MRFVFVLALSLSLAHAALAASDLDVTASSQLRLLELKYFEHTFDGDSAEERVERIEKLVRGEAGEGNPSDRVKSVVATLQADGQSLAPVSAASQSAAASSGSRNPKTASNNSGSSSQASNPAATGPGDRGAYPHVSNLEKEILKQTYEGEPLPDRLARLETKAFGQPSSGNDFGGRTDKLEDFAESVLHNKPFALNPDIEKPYIIPSSQHRQSYPVGSMAAAEEYAVQHFFAPPHRFGADFSSPALDDENTASAPPLDDPEIYQKTPPPHGTRMITRVAWCEQQLYGHTCPQMHLTRRLKQLNDSTHAVTNSQSELDLMDDMDPIEKAVAARTGSQQSLSSGSNARTQ